MFVEKTIDLSVPELKAIEPFGRTVVFEPTKITDTVLEEACSLDDDVFWKTIETVWKSRQRPEEWYIFQKILESSFATYWDIFREKLKVCESIIMLGSGGLGDTLYTLLNACVIAKAYPEKSVVAVVKGLTSIIDTTVLSRIPNLEVVTDLGGVQQLDSESTVFLDLAAKNDKEDWVLKIKEVREARKKGRFSPIIDKLKQLITTALLPSSKQPETTVVTDERNDADRILVEGAVRIGAGLINILVSLPNETLSPLNNFLRDFTNAERGSKNPAREPDYCTSAPQMLVNAVRLRYLLGVKEAGEYLESIPIKFPETQPKEFDIVFIYDAASSDTKALPLEALCALIQEAKKRDPAVRIGVVVGLDRPDIAREVAARFTDGSITLIKGTIPEVFGKIMKSKKVISVDTFWQHLINLAHHATDQIEHAQMVPPELTVVVSTNSPFALSFYAPDRGKVVVVTGPLTDLDVASIL